MTDEEDAAWPPELYRFAGDWTTYVEVLYGSYLDQFVRSTSHWRDKRIGVRYEPATAGKGYTFWHITCGLDGNGDINEPDLERCARIGWVKAVIEADPAKVLTWEQKRGRDTNVAIALPDFSFIVFLAERRDRMYLLTAYCVMRQRQRDRYRREYERSKKR
jgi:hypothetical protein